MRLKTYTAPTLAKAMDLVRADLGDDAIIVSTECADDGGGVHVTAALEPLCPDADSPLAIEDDQAGDGSADDIRRSLAQHGTPPAIVDALGDIADGVGGNSTADALAAALEDLFTFKPLGDKWGARSIVLIGPPGAGKTVTAAKLMVRAHRAGRPIAIASADSKRAGGIDQLRAFTDIVNQPLHAIAGLKDVAQVLLACRKGPLLIDTAGINPFAPREVSETRSLVEATGAEPVLVLPAGIDPFEASDIAETLAPIGIRRMIVTRVDAARRFGGLLSAASVRLSFAEVSYSPQVAEGLGTLTPLTLARLLLPDDLACAGSNPKEARR